MRRIAMLVPLFVAPGLVPSITQGAPTYVYTPLAIPTDASEAALVFPTGINDNGLIVGTYNTQFGPIVNGPSRGVIWNGPSMLTFSVPGSQNTNAVGINDSGQVVGGYDNPLSVSQHGFIRSSDGGFTTFDVPGATWTYAISINDSGQVVGEYTLPPVNNSPEHGFLRNADGSFTTIDVPGAYSTILLGINNAGEIVGRYFDTLNDDRNNVSSHGFIWNNGTFTTVNLGVGGSTSIYAINNAGAMLGSYNADIPYSTGAYLGMNGRGWTPIATSAVVNGFNDLGQIVGEVSDSKDGFDPVVGTLQTTSVPEPRSAIMLLTAGAVVFGIVRRHRR